MSSNKCALVFRGLLRNYKQAYDSIARNFIEKYDCDVFFWIWSEVGYYQGKQYLQSPNDEYVKLAENDKGFLAGETVDMNELYQWYKPKILHVEDFAIREHMFDTKKEYFKNAYTRPKNTIAQFFTIKKSLEMVSAYAYENEIHYDYMVSLRPDIVLQQDLPELEKGTFYTLPSRNKKGKGTGDSIMIADEQDMWALSTVYDNLEQIYDNIGHSCPHEYTSYFAQQMNKWQELNIPAKVAHSRSGNPYEESDDILTNSDILTSSNILINSMIKDPSAPDVDIGSAK